MTELEKWELISISDTIDDLVSSIERIADRKGHIPGRHSIMRADIMALKARVYFADGTDINFVTRNYGIRDKLISIKAQDIFDKERASILDKYYETGL